MKFLAATFVSLAVGAAIDGLPASHSIRSSLPEGYTVAPITWTMPIVPGGEDYAFQGTAQEVFLQVNAARAKLGLPPNPDLTMSADNQVSSRTGNAQAARHWQNTICNVPGMNGDATVPPIKDGIKYLRGLDGNCTIGPGRGNCGQISCSWHSAIYWCNDNDYEYSHKCSELADYGESIVDNCGVMTQWVYRVQGQAFDTENFNVMVGWGAC
ncbi:hypothetical protein F5Y19DRAFT_483731 [Xylariaceae sp. FL1651]|nr:hypothetical protein F5Y19DRAFT_483731 [Xylariaceae sp. FL1651]